MVIGMQASTKQTLLKRSQFGQVVDCQGIVCLITGLLYIVFSPMSLKSLAARDPLIEPLASTKEAERLRYEPYD